MHVNYVQTYTSCELKATAVIRGESVYVDEKRRFSPGEI